MASRLQSVRAAVTCASRRAWLRSSSTSASATGAGPRVLCSAAELHALDGKALKFPLRAEDPPASAESCSSPAGTTTPATMSTRRRKAQGFATGFVFFCQDTRQPRAFVNSCPHARLELDLDDSDFFCEGFIQCKAHGAFFDPRTGMCLQGPTGARRSSSRSNRQQASIPSLPSLEVRVEGDNVVLLEESPKRKQPSRWRHTAAATTALPGVKSQSEDDEESVAARNAYRIEKQKGLARALASRTSDVLDIQQMLHEKTMARLQRYKEEQQQDAKKKKE